MEQAEKNLLRKNIPKLSLYNFFQSFLIMIPILVPYWQGKGLTMKEIFALQGIFGAALIVFDVPAGYLADLFGRKKSMVLGSLITGIGYQIFWVGSTFFHFALFELIVGLGLSLQSGCDVALLYSSVEKIETKERTASFLGRRLFFLTIGEGIASLIGGFFARYSLDIPVYANAITAWGCFIVSLTVYDPPGETMNRSSHKENICKIARALFAHSRLLTLAIVSFIFYGFATYCAVWTFQPYWKARGVDISMFGYLWAANCFVSAFIGRKTHAIEERFGGVAVICAIGVLPVIGYLGMGLVPGLWGLAFGLAFPLCRALNSVIFQDAINSRVPQEMRSTTNSVGSLGMRALFVVFGPMLGAVIDTRGPDAALELLGLVYLAGIFVVALPLLGQRRHFRTN